MFSHFYLIWQSVSVYLGLLQCIDDSLKAYEIPMRNGSI